MPRTKTRHSEKYNSAFPTNLRLLMDKTNTTQKALGDAIDKSRQQISFYCDGTSSPDWEGVRKIAAYFSVSADWLLGLTGDPTIQKSAVDELGLSLENIQWLMNLSALQTPFANERKTVVNRLLGNSDFRLLFEALIDYSARVETKKYFEEYKSSCETFNADEYITTVQDDSESSSPAEHLIRIFISTQKKAQLEEEFREKTFISFMQSKKIPAHVLTYFISMAQTYAKNSIISDDNISEMIPEIGALHATNQLSALLSDIRQNILENCERDE